MFLPDVGSESPGYPQKNLIKLSRTFVLFLCVENKTEEPFWNCLLHVDQGAHFSGWDNHSHLLFLVLQLLISMPVNFLCYLNNISPVYEVLAKVGFSAYWIWKISCQIFHQLKSFYEFCLELLVFPLSYLADYFWNLEILSYNIKKDMTFCLYSEMFMILFGSFVVSFANFYLISFICGSTLEIHGPLFYHIISLGDLIKSHGFEFHP